MTVVCDESCCAGIDEQVVVSRPAGDPVTIVRVTGGVGVPGGWIDSLTRVGKSIVFARAKSGKHGATSTRTLYRIDGSRADLLATGVEVVPPWVVSHGLLLAAKATPFHVTGTSLLYDGRTVYDSTDGWLSGQSVSGKRGGTGDCFIGAGAILGGVRGGLLTYTTADAVHVIRMSDCRDALIADGPGIPAGSAITRSGLFYAFDARPIRVEDTTTTMARIHSRLTFLPMSGVERAVDRGLRLG